MDRTSTSRPIRSAASSASSAATGTRRAPGACTCIPHWRSTRTPAFPSASPASKRLGNVDLRVRARPNRSLGKDEEKLFEPRAAEPSAGTLEIEIARSSARTSTRTQKAKALREARVAKVSLQFRRFDLPPPGNGTGAHDPVPMTAVRRTEEDPPAGVEPRHGILLTRLPVSTRKEALRVRERYRRRGRIEDGHRVLKRGCKAEFLHHREGHRIERAVTIKAVIAWRLFARVLLGRETPERSVRRGSVLHDGNPGAQGLRP